MRLDKYISYSMDISREDARRIIKDKQITVNDKVVDNPSFSVNENRDIIKNSEQELKYEKFIYLMMNKPSGYLSATIDKNSTVLDLINEYKKYNLFIVGRLDIDSVGLLILTNDGALTHQLTSPKSRIYKKYYVEVDGRFEETDILKFKNGMQISDGKGGVFNTLESKLEIIDNNSAYISIAEGKFHQIKFMCENIGAKVTYLKRIQIGNLELDEKLKEGEYRSLSTFEIDLLKTLTKNRH